MEAKNKFHISINVSDIEKSVPFYQYLFGVEPAKEKPDYAKFELENPGLVISFIQAPDKVGQQFGHLGIRVNSNEELLEKKSTLSQFMEIALEEENTNCCYAAQNKFWVNDPDGYEWEVYHFVKDVESDKKYSVGSCC